MITEAIALIASLLFAFVFGLGFVAFIAYLAIATYLHSDDPKNEEPRQ